MAAKGSSQETEESNNLLRQFRDKQTREFKQITASQFMEVWNHYDQDGNGYIEGNELDKFLIELVTSVNTQDIGLEVVSQSALAETRELILCAFDENKDGKIDIAELAAILPTEENFLLLFRRDNPLESSVEFMKVWREFDADQSGYIEADELKHFLKHLLKQCKRTVDVTDEQLIEYADTMLQLFDRNKDGKLQLSEMSKLLPVKENFLCRPIFKGANRLTDEDIERVFNLYDRDKSDKIEDAELDGFLKDLMDLVEDDYDEEDLQVCKDILLETCDVNKDGKIDRSELTKVLTSYNRLTNQEGE